MFFKTFNASASLSRVTRRVIFSIIFHYSYYITLYYIILYLIFNIKDRQFIGYMYSSMFWSELKQQWEIVDLRTDTVVARLTGSKEYPVGVHQWMFDHQSCTDHQQQTRRLNFHLAVQQPGNFCCPDGVCIDSEGGGNI